MGNLIGSEDVPKPEDGLSDFARNQDYLRREQKYLHELEEKKRKEMLLQHQRRHQQFLQQQRQQMQFQPAQQQRRQEHDSDAPRVSTSNSFNDGDHIMARAQYEDYRRYELREIEERKQEERRRMQQEREQQLQQQKQQEQRQEQQARREQQQNNHPNQKAQCYHFLKGNCRNGDSCDRSHTQVFNKNVKKKKIAQNDTNNANTIAKPCNYFMKGNCWKGENCRFLHISGSNSLIHDTEYCRFFAMGHCKKGNVCSMSHISATNNDINRNIETNESDSNYLNNLVMQEKDTEGDSLICPICMEKRKEIAIVPWYDHSS
jgi:hypothetical protein